MSNAPNTVVRDKVLSEEELDALEQWLGDWRGHEASNHFAVMHALRQLRAALRERDADRDRLDWLDAVDDQNVPNAEALLTCVAEELPGIEDGAWVHWFYWIRRDGTKVETQRATTVSAAIDAARRATEKK